DRLQGIFRDRLAVDVHRHHERAGERLARRLADLAAARGVAVVVTNDVRHTTPAGRPLLDVLTCIRHGTTLDRAGRLLLANAERHLKSPAEMAVLFRDCPAAVRHSPPALPRRPPSRPPPCRTASPTTRCRRARRRTASCADSPTRARAGAGARSRRASAPSSTTSWLSSRSSISPATS